MQAAQTTAGARSRDLGEALRLYSTGEFDRALEALDALLGAAEGEPDLAPVHYLRGLVLKDANREAEAVEAFDRALAADPNLVRTYFHRGTARFLAGDKEGAVLDLERAVAAEPDFLFAVYNLGVAAVAKRDWERAKRAFARCLELDPGNRSEYVDLLVEIGRGDAQEEVYAQGHRLKNLLGVVGDDFRALHADLARAGLPEETLATAKRVADEIARVYADMVQFLRAVDSEPPQVDLLDIRDVLEKCLFALSPRLRSIEVEKRFAQGVPEVIGDRKSLAEALLNVLTNAIEACDGRPSARITIEVEAVDLLPIVPGVDSLRVRIRDSGPGLAPEVLDRIFQYGYTTKRFGSGLGLSYAQRVVRAHGGKIEIESPGPGLGATVTIVLPASPAGAPNLRTLGPRSVLFEDVRGLLIRSGVHGADVKK